MTALPAIVFFIYTLPHPWWDSLKRAPEECGLMTTPALTAVQLLELLPQCGLDTKGFSLRELRQKGLSQD